MKTIFLALLYIFFICEASHAQTNDPIVKIKVTQTAEYCGGAAPTPEMTEYFQTAHPLADKIVYLRKGKRNCLSEPLIELRTDSAGLIRTQLKPGFYAVIDENRRDKSYYNNIRKRFSEPVMYYSKLDKKCLKKWLQTPHQILEVKNGNNEFSVNYHRGCPRNSFPCVSYNGPYPP